MLSRKGLGLSSLLLPAMLPLIACVARPLEVHPATPLPPPAVTAPEVLRDPVERPSWMHPAVLMLLTRWWPSATTT